MAEDAKLRFRIETKEAEKDLQKIERGFERVRQSSARASRQAGAGGAAAGGGGGGGFGRAAFAGVAGGITGFALGLITSQPGTQALLGEFSRQIAQRTGIQAATDIVSPGITAREQTVQAFGLAGINASPEQIKAVHTQFTTIETRKLDSRRRVEHILGIGADGEKFEKAIDKLLDQLPEVLAVAIRAAFIDTETQKRSTFGSGSDLFGAGR